MSKMRCNFTNNKGQVMELKRANSHVLLLDAKQKRLNAGPKARLDTAIFLAQAGFRIQAVPATSSRYWQRLLPAFFYLFGKDKFESSEIVWCQFPITLPTQYILSSAKRRGCRTVAFVHDLAGLKFSPPNWDMVEMEAAQLREFSQVVGLNQVISRILQDHGVKVTASLDIWDYYCTDVPLFERTASLNKRIVFAGSLAKNKSGFIYKLGALPATQFDLYGEEVNAVELKSANVRYLNSFAPQDPPFRPDGAMGLIWDGSELDTCEGDFGAYLAFNTPHKTSMYLARGLPVVIWQGAAIAPLIAKYNAGLLISSLRELEPLMHALSEEKYSQLRIGADKLGKKIRQGYFIKTAARQIQKNFESEV
jgi:hypothetical protein